MPKSFQSSNRKQAFKWLTENYEYKTPPNDFKKWSSRDLYNVYITAKIEQHTHLSKVSFGQLVKQVFPRITKRDVISKGVRSYIYMGLASRPVSPELSENLPVVDDHSYFKPAEVASKEIQHTDSPASTSQEVNNASQPSTSQDLDRLDLENDKTSTDEDANHSEDSDSDYVPMDTDEEKPHASNNTDTLTTNLQQLLPKELTSNHSWMGFFKEQIKNCGPHKRWSIEIIQLAMDLFTRTPKGYENLRRTLHLPSPKHLQRYKNFVKQTPGINHQNMHWMLLESKRKKLSQEGKEGFIVFDEVQIQEDLQMESSKADSVLYGMTDYGPAQGSHMLRKFSGCHALASHVLQFMFLGSTGFKWPVAYYATTEAHASELMVLVWEVINQLQTYGFKITGALMDGGANNRKFIKLHDDPAASHEYKFMLQNPINYDHEIAVMMDPMHGIKKIRNSALASKLASFIRRLRRGSQFCLWEHWEDAYTWDQQHGFAIYHKLTDEHIYVTDSGKMRNHLALEAMNGEMLHLMEEYQIATGRKDLGLTIQVLKRTSVLVECFTSNRPITQIKDPRLAENMEVLEWFRQWNTDSQKDATSFITKEAFDDLNYTIQAFDHIVKARIAKHPGTRIIPSIMNSDVIENMFSSQRGRCNGSNTNPTLLAYSKAINTILLTTDNMKLSKKKNAATDVSLGGVYPYKVLADQKFSAKK